LHYTRLHPTEADTLIRFLHEGDGGQHLMAARLLAKHVPASPHVLAAFMATVREWALTTQYRGQLIFAEATRATQYPDLVPWLAELMNAEEVPWQSRTEAAAALAIRLRGAHSMAGLTYLRAVVDDASRMVGQRLAAAEALSACGTNDRAVAEQSL